MSSLVDIVVRYLIDLHTRRSKLAFQSAREERLWKRIWWAYYVSIPILADGSFLIIQIRDQQSSAALGLPSRIRDEDCDVAMLEAKDIEDEHSMENQDIFGVQRTEHVSYPIEMTKLARLCMNHVPYPKMDDH